MQCKYIFLFHSVRVPAPTCHCSSSSAYRCSLMECSHNLPINYGRLCLDLMCSAGCQDIKPGQQRGSWFIARKAHRSISHLWGTTKKCSYWPYFFSILPFMQIFSHHFHSIITQTLHLSKPWLILWVLPFSVITRHTVTSARCFESSSHLVSIVRLSSSRHQLPAGDYDRHSAES